MNPLEGERHSPMPSKSDLKGFWAIEEILG